MARFPQSYWRLFRMRMKQASPRHRRQPGHLCPRHTCCRSRQHTGPAYRASIPRQHTGPAYGASIPRQHTGPAYGASIPRQHTAPAYRASIPRQHIAPAYRAPAYCTPAYRAPAYRAPAYRASIRHSGIVREAAASCTEAGGMLRRRCGANSALDFRAALILVVNRDAWFRTVGGMMRRTRGGLA